MLALDIHETFYRENDEKSTGERLKNVMLYPGAGELQGVLYRKFQAFLKCYLLNTYFLGT